MRAVFYTAASFLDISLEVINVLKKIVELHILIEITPNSKNNTILDVEKLPENKIFVTPSELLDDKNLKYLEPYFEGTASVTFVVFSKKGLPAIFSTGYKIGKYIKQIKPDVIHIEALMIRSIGLIPALLSCKNLLLSIHDPVQHSGEKNWKMSLVKMLFFNFPVPKAYVFYSEFAKHQFEKHYKGNKALKWVIKMNPYLYLNNYKKKDTNTDKYILFFGRISRYKGIEVLLKAIPLVFDEFSNEKLIIAGRSINGYSIAEKIPEKYKDNISVINGHISNEELVRLITESKFIVCPYIDATQSGVLMTSFGLGTPVIASDTGAFPEYIEDTINGLLTPVGDAQVLSEKIIYALNNDFYKSMKNNIKSESKSFTWTANTEVLKNAYHLKIPETTDL